MRDDLGGHALDMAMSAPEILAANIDSFGGRRI